MAISEVDKLKQCSLCKEVKPIIEFHKDKTRKDGHKYRCKTCWHKECLKWQHKNPKRYAEIRKRSYQKHRINRVLKDRCYQAGITVKEYLELFRTHNGKCDICGVSHLELNQSLCIDHNHGTGKIRGLLCKTCNSILGFCKDNPVILENAIAYLRKEFSNEYI